MSSDPSFESSDKMDIDSEFQTEEAQATPKATQATHPTHHRQDLWAGLDMARQELWAGIDMDSHRKLLMTPPTLTGNPPGDLRQTPQQAPQASKKRTSDGSVKDEPSEDISELMQDLQLQARRGGGKGLDAQLAKNLDELKRRMAGLMAQKRRRDRRKMQSKPPVPARRTQNSSKGSETEHSGLDCEEDVLR